MDIKLRDDQKIKIRTDADLFPIMREILLRDSELDQTKEHFWAAGLASNTLLQCVELISLGSLRETVVEPMDVFGWAMQKRVSSIILVHNHPSGELKATPHDMALTKRMVEAGRLMNIPVLDHMVITRDRFYSYQQNGLIHAAHGGA